MNYTPLNFNSGSGFEWAPILFFGIIGFVLLIFSIALVFFLIWLVRKLSKQDIAKKEKTSKEVERINDLLASGKVTASEAADLKQSLGAAAMDRKGDDREGFTWGMLCHLACFSCLIGLPCGWFLGPFLVWLLKRNEHEFVDDQGKEALNFQISMTIYGILSLFLCLLCIGFLIFPVLIVLAIIFPIIAAIKANQGIRYRYPMTIRFFPVSSSP